MERFVARIESQTLGLAQAKVTAISDSDQIPALSIARNRGHRDPMRAGRVAGGHCLGALNRIGCMPKRRSEIHHAEECNS